MTDRLILLPSNKIPESFTTMIDTTIAPVYKFILGYRNVITLTGEWNLIPGDRWCGLVCVYHLKEGEEHNPASVELPHSKIIR